MPSQYSRYKVEIALDQNLSCWVYSEQDLAQNTLVELPADIASQNGEEPVQLLEGATYEYELTDKKAQIQESSGIVRPSRRQQHRGRLTPGIYVGRLALTVISASGESLPFAVEVRSTKANYRSEYRRMLEDITHECTELLMLHSSPVNQAVTVDYTGPSATLYQRFAFVKSIVDSDDFKNAIHRVISMPVTAWTHHSEEVDTRRSRRISSKQIRQMTSRSDRVKLPRSHPLSTRMASIPARLSTEIKIDTVDTPENRFAKHALKEFARFCGVVCQYIERKHTDTVKRPRIYTEARDLEERFSEYLNHNMFREVGVATTLPLNSPVLQRKEGYRKILRVWLMYDLAAQLIWNDFDNDTYAVGKRDVATLYEYWLFFKLLRLMEDIFAFEPMETQQLIAKTKDGLGLKLKAGKHTAITGTYQHRGRDLRIKFNYNRTFSPTNFPQSGSWTQQMRPDYTLSIWPQTFSETEAEEQELIVHVHFDAKYKVEGLEYLTAKQDDYLSEEKNSELLNDEKEMQKKGTYKRADLLKMHAYKDAIRRTVGAYVLYPGTKAHECRGFHEIVPGLGAFPISPANNDDLQAIRKFIYEIVEHFTNRASQREELSYRIYEIHKPPSSDHELHEMMPEIIDGYRAAPPITTTVLVGYCKSDQHYDWICDRGLYNIRIDNMGGPVEFSSAITDARYLLLHREGKLKSNEIWRITADAPVMMDKKTLSAKGYPTTPSKEYYLVYRVEEVGDKQFANGKWDIRKFPQYKSGRSSARPFSVTLAEMMRATVSTTGKHA